jgi:ABC-type Na+ efflux pump permease subunit
LVTWTWFAIIVSVQSAALTDRGFLRGYQVWENFLAWLLVFSMAASAAGSFRRERETGVLELLLVSPLTTGQIIGGRLRGLWGQFLPSIILLLGIWIHFANILPNSESSFAQIWFFMVTYTILPVIGLYFSVSCRHFLTAFLLTLTFAIVVPNGIAMLLTHFWNERFAGSVWLFQCMLAICFASWLQQKLRTRSFPLERGVA